MSVQHFLESDSLLFRKCSSTQSKFARSPSFNRKMTPSRLTRDQSSIMSHYSPLTISPGLGHDSFPQRTLVTEISDYQDKSQIFQAISFANSKEEKIRVIDHIIKSREEIEQSKKKKKSSKASSRLAQAVEIVSQNLAQQANNINRFKQSLNELVGREPVLKDLNPSIPSLIGSGATPKTLLRKKYTAFVADNKTREDSDEESNSSKSDEGSKLVFPEENPILLQRVISGGNGYPSFSSLSSTNGRRFGGLGAYADSLTLKRNTSWRNLSASKVLALSKRKESSSPSASPHVRELSQGSLSVVRENNMSRDGNGSVRKVSNERDPVAYALGSKKLEKDIYRYLLKTEGNEEENQVILKLNHKKREKMRDIEAKAIMQYKQTRREEREASDYQDSMLKSGISMSERVRMKSTDNNQNPDFYQSSRRNEEKSGLMRLDQGKRSSSFIRKVNSTRVYNDESVKKKKRKESIRHNLNDSLYSYTESRLDCLYKQASSTNKGLKQIERKMTIAKDKEESKNLLKVRELKIRDLNDLSGKIKLLIKKKITNAFG